jgi:hypothetical protein
MLAFFAGFVLSSTSLSWMRVFVLGWYEKKWSAGFSFALDAGGLLLVGALATGAFAVSVSLVERPNASPTRAFFGALLLAPAFMLAASLSRNTQFDLLAHVINWGTLLLGASAIGILVHSRPRAHAQEP